MLPAWMLPPDWILLAEFPVLCVIPDVGCPAFVFPPESFLIFAPPFPASLTLHADRIAWVFPVRVPQESYR